MDTRPEPRSASASVTRPVCDVEMSNGSSLTGIPEASRRPPQPGQCWREGLARVVAPRAHLEPQARRPAGGTSRVRGMRLASIEGAP
jgi:hypothetical protein